MMFITFQALGHHGRLGNQLFQIAATLGAARVHQCDFVLPPWKYSGYFEYALPQSEKIEVQYVYMEPDFAYRPIPVNGNTSISGNFQSERYFAHCQEELRHYLTPNSKLAGMVRELKDRYLADIPAEKACSVSVRRGDYIGHSCFAELVATQYYHNALSQIGKDQVKVVFSDDINWCREFFARREFESHRFVFVEPSHELADLFLIAACTNHILANSSYSWWGAWLDPNPEKMVFVPDAWFAGQYINRNKTFMERGYHDIQDLCPASWHRIPVTHQD